MKKTILFESDKVVCEIEKLDKDGNPVTRRKTVITAGIAGARELVILDGAGCTREIELEFLLESGERHTARMDINELIDRKKFMKAINRLEIVVSATEDEMGLFRLTLVKQPVFSTNIQHWYSGIFERSGQLVYMDCHGYVTADSGSWNKSIVSDTRAPHRDLTGISEVPEETIEEALERLHTYGPPDRCAAVIGFAQAAALNWHLEQLGYELPVLYLTGETGAGKTATLEKILQPLTGCEGEKPIMSDALTMFPLAELASRSNMVPLIMDENKESTFSAKNRHCLSNFIRNTYSGGRLLRGTKDLDVTEYIMRRPLVLAGETGLEEAALKNRTITCGFYGSDITPERRDSFAWLASHTDALRAVSWKMLRYALSLSAEDVQAAIDRAAAYAPDLFQQDRVRKNFTIILAGYMLFSEKFCIETDISAAASALADSMYEHVMGSSTTPETEAVQFFCALAEMTEVDAEAGYYLAYDRYYHYDAEKDAIWLNINNTYPLYYNYCRHTGTAAVPKSDLQKQLKHNPGIMAAEDKVFSRRGAKSERRKMFYLKALPVEMAGLFRRKAMQPSKAIQLPEAMQPPKTIQPPKAIQPSLFAS